MITNTLRALVVLMILGLAGAAAAQATRDSAAPQTGDGNRPGDGAITGGSIVPGESGGVPAGPTNSAAERIKRCRELTGTLREECLLQERGASTGGTSTPGTAPSGADAKAPGPRTDPPPQIPR
jgi:hypothetical protein